MPFVVPTLPAFSFSNWGNAGVTRNLTPTQSGSTSRIGGSLYAAPPAGIEATFTAWGFRAGTAPPGTNFLLVTASGFATIERGYAGTLGGYASAYGDIAVTIEEFVPVLEPLEPVPHSGLVDTHDSGTVDAEIAPPPTATLGSKVFVFERAVTNPPTIIINQYTLGFGFQADDGDGTPYMTTLLMAITPGNAYRWWIICQQQAICQGVSGPAGARCNISFDFGSVFFAFTS